MGNVHRLIAFDLDGTLIDSRRDLADAANDLIAELGGLPLAEAAIAAMVGEGATLLVRRALTAARLVEPPDAVSRFLAFYDARLLNYTRPYPGVIDVVHLAREYARVAVLTNKPKPPTERILDGLGIRDLFHEVIGGDGPLPRKPDPAGLLALMESAAVGRQATLLVGDSPIDFRTARNAGTRCCLVSFGFGFRGFAHGEPDGIASIAANVGQLADVIRAFAQGPVS